MSYLRELRLRRGANCCGTPTSPSNVIAHRVGFATRSHSHAFTEQFGRSPTLVQSADG